MFEDREIQKDLFALAMLVVSAFLALSLVSYDAADPPVTLVAPFDRLYSMDTLVYPVNERITNFCGRWGSLAASILLDGLGYGAYYVVLSLGVVAGLLLGQREVETPITRTIGWCMSLLGFVTLGTMLSPWTAPGTVVGAGGHLGLMLAGFLRMQFANVGGVIFASSIFLGGLLLCTDYAVLRMTIVVSTLLITVLAQQPWLARLVPSFLRRGGVNGEAEDEYEYEEYDEDANEPLSVRIRGKQISAADEALAAADASERAAEEHDDEDEYDEDEVCDEEEDENDYEDEESEEEDEAETEDSEQPDEVAASDMSDENSLSVTSPAMRRGAARRRRLAALRINVDDADGHREEVMNQLEEASLREDNINYELPAVTLLRESEDFSFEAQEREVRRKARVLMDTFASFGFDVRVKEVETGPVIAQYEVELEAGLRLSKITGLADDLAIALRVPSVRIVAPIPGKNTVGIEVPNEERQLVRLREVMEESDAKIKKMRIPLFLGKDVSGNSLTVDLSSLPHLLIAGRTGTGKSVCLNAIIASILMTRRPDEVRMLMIDPKMVELSGYRSLPHLMHPVVTDMRKAEAILAWAVEKMEERYQLLARAGVRHISSYNQLSEEEIMDRMQPDTDEERSAIPMHMPYIVIVADEMADLMMTAGKEVETHIIRLAQKSRAVGIHLILATQKPTVDVITGLIKSNLPARIAFQVASRTDSRVVLDEMGADKLLGNGDMLFLYPGTSTLLRGQGTYLGDDEINDIVAAASQMEQNFVAELVDLKVADESGDGNGPGEFKKRDELYEKAVEVVLREGRGSCSLLQRALGIGYGRAARLIDFMAEDGLVGPYAGSQAREVTMSFADWEKLRDSSGGDSAAAKPASTVTIDESPAHPVKSTAPKARPKNAKPAAPKPIRPVVRIDPDEVEEQDELEDDNAELDEDSVDEDDVDTQEIEDDSEDACEEEDAYEEEDECEEGDYEEGDWEEEDEFEEEDYGEPEEEVAEEDEDGEYEYVYVDEDEELEDDEEYEYVEVDDEDDSPRYEAESA